MSYDEAETEGVHIGDGSGCTATIGRYSQNGSISLILRDADILSDNKAAQPFSRDHAVELADAITSKISDIAESDQHVKARQVYRMAKPRPESKGWRNSCFYVDKVQGDLALVTHLGQYLTFSHPTQHRIDLNRCEMEEIERDMLTRTELSNLDKHLSG